MGPASDQGAHGLARRPRSSAGASGTPIAKADLSTEMLAPVEATAADEADPLGEAEDQPLYYNAFGYDRVDKTKDTSWMGNRQGHLLSLKDPATRLACKRYRT